MIAVGAVGYQARFLDVSLQHGDRGVDFVGESFSTLMGMGGVVLGILLGQEGGEAVRR